MAASTLAPTRLEVERRCRAVSDRSVVGRGQKTLALIAVRRLLVSTWRVCNNVFTWLDCSLDSYTCWFVGQAGERRRQLRHIASRQPQPRCSFRPEGSFPRGSRCTRRVHPMATGLSCAQTRQRAALARLFDRRNRTVVVVDHRVVLRGRRVRERNLDRRGSDVEDRSPHNGEDQPATSRPRQHQATPGSIGLGGGGGTRSQGEGGGVLGLRRRRGDLLARRGRVGERLGRAGWAGPAAGAGLVVTGGGGGSDVVLGGAAEVPDGHCGANGGRGYGRRGRSSPNMPHAGYFQTSAGRTTSEGRDPQRSNAAYAP